MDKKRVLKQLAKINSLKGNMRLAGEKWKTKYQTLTAIIFSARTLDETTIRVCKNLFEKYPDAISLSKLSEEEVQIMINPINFYKNKSRNILNCAKALVEEYNGEPPLDFDKLIDLPGVGAKTANVFLSEYGNDEIGVDTHVAYISHYLGWTNSKKPREIEADLKSLFPKSSWRNLNPTLVKFGKKYTNRKEKNKLLDEVKLIH